MKYLYALRRASIFALILLATTLLVSGHAIQGRQELRRLLEATDGATESVIFLAPDGDAGVSIQNLPTNINTDNGNSFKFGALATGTKSSVLPNQSFQVLDELQEYAQACDQAIGVTVDDFICDAGTEVPLTNPVKVGDKITHCDRPNRLSGECDPGSHFQVLTNTADAYVVAHCRKKGLADGQYGDIAVIQYNQNNGATCFYQALGDLNGQVKAPSKGVGDFWMTPAEIAASNFPCASCHDNGPLIRSPYITQDMGHDTIPGAGDYNFNKDQPYYFVGRDFASWQAYSVEVKNADGSKNLCNTCHRMGVNNLGSGGTALDFGIRATAMSETAKNPHSEGSPIWMPPTLPNQEDEAYDYNKDNATAANAIRACAQQWIEHPENPLPSTPECTITPLTGPNVSCAGPLYVDRGYDRAYIGRELGTTTKPFHTLTTAYNYACSGATLRIRAGNYSQNLTLDRRINVEVAAEGGTVTIGRQQQISNLVPDQESNITSPDNTLRMTFPIGAVNEPATVEIMDTSIPSKHLTNFQFAGRAFDITATNTNGDPITSFNQPFSFQLTYDDSDWQSAGITDESSLNVYYSTGGEWLPTLPCSGCTHNTSSNSFAVQLDHLTLFALLAPDTEPSVESQIFLPVLER